MYLESGSRRKVIRKAMNRAVKYNGHRLVQTEKSANGLRITYKCEKCGTHGRLEIYYEYGSTRFNGELEYDLAHITCPKKYE